ncbi:hypothetical protein ASPCAL06828 [Aspergillus calidoustus]|uniref:Uncharacterized protein n=1 Tax=Aspergillus calidoustus TaxID=454130 RepID=A0A0U5G1V9_ASPCI|nr:hypothetical protein ASPCAL06828 [Aspergillus calidoustus]
MRTHCQPCEPKPTLGFFGTIGSIISACMHAIFGIVLPTVIALAIVFLILFFIVVAVVTIADSLGWPGFITKYKQREKESKRMEAGKKVGSDIEGLKLLGEGEGEGDVGLGGDGDGEITDVGDRKRRIEVEIEFLETLLRVKMERLRALQ